MTAEWRVCAEDAGISAFKQRRSFGRTGARLSACIYFTTYICLIPLNFRKQGTTTNEEQVRRQMQYGMVPSAHHINSRVAPPAPAPSSGIHRNPMVQAFPGGMPLDSSNGFPVNHHRQNLQAALEPSRTSSMGGPQRHGRPFRQTGPEIYGQPSALPSTFLEPPGPLGGADDSQHLLQPSSATAPSPEEDFRGCSSGAVGEEASGTSVGSFQALLHDDQTLPDTGRVFSTDELSLSNTLLNLSLDEQPANGGGSSGGRQSSDLIVASVGRVGMFGACGASSPLRGMGFGDGEGFGAGSSPPIGGRLDGSLPNRSIFQDRFHGQGLTDSSQLLMAPAHGQTGASQAEVS